MYLFQLFWWFKSCLHWKRSDSSGHSWVKPFLKVLNLEKKKESWSEFMPFAFAATLIAISLSIAPCLFYYEYRIVHYVFKILDYVLGTLSGECSFECKLKCWLICPYFTVCRSIISVKWTCLFSLYTHKCQKKNKPREPSFIFWVILHSNQATCVIFCVQ